MLYDIDWHKIWIYIILNDIVNNIINIVEIIVRLSKLLSNIIVLLTWQGDWAWLKRLPYGNFQSITPYTSGIFELVGFSLDSLL